MSLPFTRRLSLLFGNELSKIVINLLTGNLDTFLDEANYGKLVENMEDPGCKHSKAEILDTLLKNMGRGADWSKAIRTYMVVHKLIHKQGDEMSLAFTPERYRKFSDVKLPKKIPLKKHEIQPLLPLYLEYLQQLAKHHKDLSVCFAGNEAVEDDLLENSASLLEFLSTAQNILGILLKMFPLIQTILGATKGTGLLKQATYYCLTDAHNIYTYLNTIIGLMINEIFNLPKEDATTLYQIYSEHVLMTKKLKAAFDLKNHLTDFYLTLPEFFQINITFNSQVEIYIANLKRGQFARREKNCSLGMEQPREGNSISPREDPQVNAKSLCEISQSVVRSISNLHVSDKTQPILPPKFFARRQNMNAAHGVPKIKVKRPANKFCDPEANVFLKKGCEANCNLLKVPIFEDDVHLNNSSPPEEHPPEEHTVAMPIQTTERYTLQVRCNSQNLLQVPSLNKMSTLLVPQVNFFNQINQQQPATMGSCRSLQSITPTRSLGGSFAAETISVENLS